MASRAFKILPKNYLQDWGEFEAFAEGASSAPSGWLSASSPFLISRESTNIKFGSYAALLVGSAALGSSSAGVAGLYRTVPNGSDYAGKTFTFGIWAKSASTGPYVELDDGVTTKTVHLDGLNAYYFLTVPPTKLSVTATQIRLNLFATKAATVYFDGAVLCEGEDLYTTFDTNIDVAKWSPSLNYKGDQYEASQSEGSIVPDIHRQQKGIKLSGQVVGSDVTSARSNLDTFLESLVAWQASEKRNLYLYDDRVAEVYLKNIDHDYKNGLQFIPYSLSFINPEGVTRSNAKYRSRTVISGSITEFNLTYNGNAESKPVISFIANQGGAITTCSLKNLTTSETMTYFGTVPTGVALDIDCAAGTVLNSSVNKIADFQTSDFLKLVRGTNYFRFSGSNCTINIDYYERFLS